MGAVILVAALAAVWLNNTSIFTRPEGGYRLLAHRGLAQTFDISLVEWDTNTARMIAPPEHHFLENTIASMEVAFERYGADVVELDVQRTADGRLAVFHDADLAMRTDGAGGVRDHTMAELRQLDVGYGYTADDGRSYPFRGRGVGLLPEFGEVLAAFPDRDLGNDAGLTYLRAQDSRIRVLSAERLKDALLRYELVGWTGYVPPELHNLELHLPIGYAGLLWGWPHRFVERMDAVNTRVVLVDGDGTWSAGFDTADALARVPDGFTGYVWTDRIDLVSRR